jgi:CRP-like cAMP-binding protein
MFVLPFSIRSFRLVSLIGNNAMHSYSHTDFSRLSHPLKHPPIMWKTQEGEPSHLNMSAVTKFKKHTPVFYAGDEATKLFEVISGSVMVYVLLVDGRRQVVDIVLPSGICGFSLKNTYISNCETLENSLIRVYHKRDIANSEELRSKILEKAEMQLCQMHEHALSLGRKTAEERVATLLARFSEHGTINKHHCTIIELPLTRGEMGDYLGLSLETVCRILASLQKQGVIEIGRRHGEIIIVSLARLRRIASLDSFTRNFEVF